MSQPDPQTMRPVLYSFRRCPYAMRARLALASAGVTVELREILLRDKPPSLLEVSAKATVPVLVLPDRVIDESYDIMLWALSQADPEGWLAGRDEALIAALDGPFKAALDRYKYGTDDVEAARETASAFLRQLEARLARQPALGGAQPGLADMASLTFIRQFANVDRPWFDAQPWPHLRAWLDNFLASTRFAAIMRKYPAWQSGDPATLFPESA
jgi:glutathione S-transferase